MLKDIIAALMAFKVFFVIIEAILKLIAIPFVLTNILLNPIFKRYWKMKEDKKSVKEQIEELEEKTGADIRAVVPLENPIDTEQLTEVMNNNFIQVKSVEIESKEVGDN